MADDRIILLCSCEGTMPLDADPVRKACRGGVERFRQAMATGRPVTVACTQEAPLFGESAGDAADQLQFVNIRETAGWSHDADAAGPQMAALMAAAAEPMPATPFVALDSEGVILIYGRDERAIEAARLPQP